MQLGTLGTHDPVVPTVPTTQDIVGTDLLTEIYKPKQRVSSAVPTVPTVPTQKDDFRSFSDPTAPQADPNRCHVCGEREMADRLFIAVLTDRPGAHHWLHADCHDEHMRRCAERRAS